MNLTLTKPEPQPTPAPSAPAQHQCVQTQCTCNQTRIVECARSCACCKWCIRQAWEESLLVILLGGIFLPFIIDYIVLDRPSDAVGLTVLGVCFTLSVISFWHILPYRLRRAHEVARELRGHTHIHI